MRGGSSRGPYFDLRDLPSDSGLRDQALLRVMGSPDLRQIDGLGGADTVTSKVAMVRPSTLPGVDVDYLFAQIGISNPIVDTSPPCGNMMAGVGPFAIERGMVPVLKDETMVTIFNLNTKSTVEAIVQTPNGIVEYEGDTQISGVPGRGAPIVMNLYNQTGLKTGSLFPTSKKQETIDRYPVTLIDAGTAMLLLSAKALGLSGREDATRFTPHSRLMDTIEILRIEAGQRMGLGDVRDQVLPKVALLSPSIAGGNIRSQYLTPHALHPTHAVSGAIAIATALKIPGTVASEIANPSEEKANEIRIEHPSGWIDITLDIECQHGKWNIIRAGAIRTARKIMDGFVYVPDNII